MEPFPRALDAASSPPCSERHLSGVPFGRDADRAVLAGAGQASTWRAVSCGWAGGGIVTTPADLAVHRRPVPRSGGRPATRDWLSRRHRFRSGLRYGAGTMEVRFEEFFFLLRGLPRLRGHLGILATHAWYDPDSDTEIVLNFHSTRQLTASFRLLTALMQTLRR